MIDIHCHLLPGVDDGPTSLDTALSMAELAQRGGTTALIATPHQRHPAWHHETPAALRRAFDEVRRNLAEPRLALGAEIRVTSSLCDDLERDDLGGLLPLAGSRYLLVEFERSPLPEVDPVGLVHELEIAGWRPILAHPEFVPWLAADLRLCEDLVARGALLQITAMSVTGEFGRRPAETCERLLRAGLVHFVASDGHAATGRVPVLDRAYRHLCNRWGTDIADRLLAENPACVLANRELTAEVGASQ
jgi:protein-tyrosine phosphatase